MFEICKLRDYRICPFCVTSKGKKMCGIGIRLKTKLDQKVKEILINEISKMPRCPQNKLDKKGDVV